MKVRAGLLWCAASANGLESVGLTLDVFNNTVLAGSPTASTTLPTTALSLPGAAPFSAELSGSFSPPTGSPATWSWNCSFANIELAFVTIDGHTVCNSSAAYNSSVAGLIDSTLFRLLSKRDHLVVRMQLYHLAPSAGPSTASVAWCADGGASCALLPTTSLSPALPAPEIQRRSLQRTLAQGWGNWLHRDILSVVLLPDSAVVTVMICQISTGVCLREVQIDQVHALPRHRLVNAPHDSHFDRPH
jgi:hypothetical protein